MQRVCNGHKSAQHAAMMVMMMMVMTMMMMMMMMMVMVVVVVRVIEAATLLTGMRMLDFFRSSPSCNLVLFLFSSLSSLPLSLSLSLCSSGSSCLGGHVQPQ